MLLTVAALAEGPAPTLAQTTAGPDEGIAEFLQQLQDALHAGDPAGYLELVSPSVADREPAQQFVAGNMVAGATNAVVREADRAPLSAPSDAPGYRLMVEIFIERGQTARVATWRLDVRRERTATGQPEWRIVGQERLTSVEGLYRLAVNPEKQFTARNLVVQAQDLTLRLPIGSAFVAETDFGVTALVLLGRGEMEFAPEPRAEQGQVKILSGAEVLRTGFDSAFVRLNPDDFTSRVSVAALTERTVRASDLRRARVVFDRELPRSFGLDLAGLSTDRWSVIPNAGDILAEIRTRRFDTLTYVRTRGEPEDIRLFDRERKRNIAVYASKEKLAERGRFYDEDQFVDYDVLDYSLDVSLFPEREWVQGRATLRLRATQNTASLNIRLADALVVRSAQAIPFGRLLPLRAPGQDSVILNFPTTIPRDFQFTISMTYAGRMPPQRPAHETIGQEGTFTNPTFFAPQPHFLYSNRTYWYPQAMVTDYATATLRLTVPAGFECVGSGEPIGGVSPVTGSAEEVAEGRRFTFTASQPVRYLAALVSRFTGVEGLAVRVDRDEAVAGDGNEESPERAARRPGVFYDSLALTVEANPRQVRRGRELIARSTEIVKYYGSLIGDVPYPSFTLALVEGETPGGHSPAYFALLNQPLPAVPFTWGNDPVHFEDFPDFFLAHELAHQWWGQAVGWNNYHEQWLSEGFAQYFAVLFAHHARGDDLVASVFRQMRRTALEQSDQGPIYLGYRLGHIQGRGRVFRSLVYNKGALVLHMLRGLIGDDAFFAGLRRYYAEWRFRKAGTEDLRRAMEAETNVSLERFFERWIYDSGVPRLNFGYRVENPMTPGANGGTAGSEVLLRFEQREPIFDLPVTVTLNYATGGSSDVVVRVTEPVTELRVPLSGPLRGVEVNRDAGTLAEIVRN